MNNETKWQIPAGTFEHAKLVQTRWGIGLAMIELRERDDVECLRLQLWAPVAADGDAGQVTFRIALNPDASDEAHDRMSEANRKALVEMTTESFEKAVASVGVAEVLDDVFAKAALS